MIVLLLEATFLSALSCQKRYNKLDSARRHIVLQLALRKELLISKFEGQPVTQTAQAAGRSAVSLSPLPAVKIWAEMEISEAC